MSRQTKFSNFVKGRSPNKKKDEKQQVFVDHLQNVKLLWTFLKTFDVKFYLSLFCHPTRRETLKIKFVARQELCMMNEWLNTSAFGIPIILNVQRDLPVCWRGKNLNS